MSSETFKKFDSGKPRMSLIGQAWLWGTIKVLEIGAEKYGPGNWEKGTEWSRYFDALQRHVWAWWYGESIDPETGQSHLYHASCCLMFLAEFDTYAWGSDDRPGR